MIQSTSELVLTSPQPRLEMPMNWGRPKSSRLTHQRAVSARRVIVAIDV